jgi:hypothetical protein
VEGKRGSECLLKPVSNIDFNPDGVRVYFEDKKMQQYFYDFMGINKEIQ